MYIKLKLSLKGFSRHQPSKGIAEDSMMPEIHDLLTKQHCIPCFSLMA